MWGPSQYAFLDPKMPKSFDLCIFRGCPYQCSYCGGGSEAHRIISGRDRVSLKSPERVLEEAMILKEKAIEEVRLEYIGYPDHYLRLFNLMKRENLGLSCRLSFWTMPPKEVLEKAKDVFWRVSGVISPDSGSERVRRLNKGCYYSNDQLSKTVKFLEAEDSNIDLWFTVGLPGETLSEFDETLNLADKLIRENSNIANAYSFGVSAEPASPIFRDPARYDMILSRRKFMDYYDLWKGVEADSTSIDVLGLRRKDLPQESIVEMNRKFRLRIKDALARNQTTEEQIEARSVSQ